MLCFIDSLKRSYCLKFYFINKLPLLPSVKVVWPVTDHSSKTEGNFVCNKKGQPVPVLLPPLSLRWCVSECFCPALINMQAMQTNQHVACLCQHPLFVCLLTSSHCGTQSHHHGCLFAGELKRSPSIEREAREKTSLASQLVNRPLLWVHFSLWLSR